MIMCVVWLGVCIVVLCPSKRSSGSKGVPLLVQERCKKAARFAALGRGLSKLGLWLGLVATVSTLTEAQIDSYVEVSFEGSLEMEIYFPYDATQKSR
jgi:hypothetical protein